MKLIDLKISQKLNLGFGILIFLLVGVTSVGIISLLYSQKASYKSDLANWADAFLITARVDVRTYFHYEEMENFVAAQKNIDSTLIEVDDLIDILSDEKQLEELYGVKEGLNSYMKALEDYKSIVDEKNNLLASIKELGDNIGRLIGYSDINLVNARMNYLYYLSYKDTTAIDRCLSSMGALNRGSSGNLTVLSDKYISEVRRILPLMNKMRAAEDAQAAIGVDLMASLDGLVEEFSDEADIAKSISIYSLIVLALLALGYGFYVSNRVGKYFRKAIAINLSMVESLALGDLNVVVDNQFLTINDEFGDLSRATKNLTSKLSDILSGVFNSADNVSGASSQSSGASQQLAQGANEQASGVEEISSTMEEIASNVQQNTENAQEAERTAITLLKEFELVGEATAQSLQQITNIAEKINVINEIAVQTNILALNAAVESANAGEHGKGFAVVATEIRRLAERSKISASEIITLAAHSLTATQEATEKFTDLNESLNNTIRLVQEIAAASIEQNSGVSQVDGAIQQLNVITQQNAAAADEMASSSVELASQAEHLKEMISYFKIGNIDVDKLIIKGDKMVTKSKKEVVAADEDSSKIDNKIVGNRPDEVKINLGIKDSDGDYESF